MNWETLAIGMTEYVGIASLLLAALLVGAVGLRPARLAPARRVGRVNRRGVSRSLGYSE